MTEEFRVRVLGKAEAVQAEAVWRGTSAEVFVENKYVVNFSKN